MFHARASSRHTAFASGRRGVGRYFATLFLPLPKVYNDSRPCITPDERADAGAAIAYVTSATLPAKSYQPAPRFRARDDISYIIFSMRDMALR